MAKSKSDDNKFNSIVETIGNTPIIRLSKTFSRFPGQYFGKMETFNPGGSSKDRIGVTIIDDAEAKGLLKEGGTIVEATSGNTGLGLALVGIDRGYNVILVLPDKMSPEKINILKAIGCEVVVCPTEVEPDDPNSYYSVSKRIAEETEGAFYANQYFNPANPKAHYEMTGPEIWEQTNGEITHFFAGVGTGGTISGVGRYLKEKNPDIKIIGIDPEGSILAHYHKTRNKEVEAHSYKVEGVGEDIIPSTVDFDIIDQFIIVNDKESFDWTRELARKEALLLGGSSGLAAAGAAKFASETEREDIYGVILFPDGGERYLGKIYSNSWLRANGFMEPPTDIGDILSAKPANIPNVIYVNSTTSLKSAMEKFRKFRVNQLVVADELGDKNPKLLPKNILYNELLKGNHDMKVMDLNLSDLSQMDLHASLTELVYELINSGITLITENDSWVGLLTKQDIIDNMPIDELKF